MQHLNMDDSYFFWIISKRMGDPKRVQEFEDSRIRGFEDSRIRGFEDSRIRGFEDSRIRGFQNIFAFKA